MIASRAHSIGEQSVRRHLAEFGLAAPCGFGLRPTQSLWFVGTKGRRDRPVRPRYPTLGGLIPRPARRDIAPAIPQEVALGYHGCFGTLSGWPSRQPPDLGGTVMLLNAAIAASGRRVDCLHLPTLGTADDAFFAPLERLRAQDANVYLGAIHHLHDADGLRRQLPSADRLPGLARHRRRACRCRRCRPPVRSSLAPWRRRRSRRTPWYQANRRPARRHSSTTFRGRRSRIAGGGFGSRCR